jgi:phospho-N-acetylmuramoyl-pentapeptide-transferase
LVNEFALLNIARYLTFRAIVSLLSALFISIFCAPWFIQRLRYKQIGQVVRNDGPKSHFSKAGTPTMGGGLIVLAVVIPSLLWMDWSNHYLWCSLIIFIGYSLLGFSDDYKKIKHKNSRGVPGKVKMAFQIGIALLALAVHYYYSKESGILYFPFFKNAQLNLGLWYIPFAVFVIVGTSNAVNLTDGLDGLAIGPVMIAAACFAILAYVSGNALIAQYLQFPYISGSGELAIFAAAIVGAGMGFLWYNTYPAQVFMGDVGSLPLGGALASIAVFSKHEILLAIIGGVFVLEAVSVISQVASFKLTGRRIFRMAPIHHHFELKGWPEPKVIVRFWIISVVLALLGLLSLKIR